MAQPITQNDNTSFFHGIYQDVWRKMIHPGLTEAEVDFIQDVCGLQLGESVLDIMCGYGRHALALARRGYPITAIDSSEGYAKEIEEIAAAESLPVTAIYGDVSEMTLSGTYKAAVCMGNSFAFLNEASVRKVLQQLSTVLQPGGCFVVNSWMIGEVVYRHFKDKTWHQVDEYKYLIESRFLMHPSRIEADHIIVSPDGGVQTLRGVDYVYCFSEIEKMLGEAGFRLQDVYYTPRKRRFQLGDNNAYLVAVKQ